MSEQEFDLYLKLLAKCLRLTSGQRELIADELRDHLEERLEELARAGVPRERAIAQALDEFGDAAVLAAHFTTIARLKRRRFLMRLSLGSVGALTAALLIGYAFWPDNRAIRGPEQVVAQEKTNAEKPKAEKPKAELPKGEPAEAGKAAVPSKPHSAPPAARPARAGVRFLPVEHPLSSDLARQPPVEARITEALDQPVDFTIEPQSLKDALDFIAARYQIPILIDQKALDDANVDVTTEVRLAAPGVPLRDALQLIFGQMASPLSYDVIHGVLMVTTEDKLKEHLETIVYDCRDLIKLPALAGTVTNDRTQADVFGPVPAEAATPAGQAPAKAKKAREEKVGVRLANNPPFIRMVVSATGAEFWEEDASISELGGLLIVRQNPRVHDRIKALLASIRLMRKDGAFAGLEGETFQPRPQQPGSAGAVWTPGSKN